MDFMFFCIIFLIIVFLARLYCMYRDTRIMPPSPVRPLPVVGHLLHLKKDFRPQYKKWRRHLYIGSKLLIVLNGYDVIKEALIRRADDFSDRPVMVFDELMGYQGKGLAFASGDVWREHRSVTLNIFRKLGLDENVLATRVTTEVNRFLGHLDKSDGQPVNIRELISASTSSIICAILLGRVFQYDDPRFENIIRDIQTIISKNQQIVMMSYFPLLKLLPLDVLGYKRLLRTMDGLYGEFKLWIEESRNRDPRDNFIAAYLTERTTRVRQGHTTTLDEINLLKVVSDLFIAGSETTSATIVWFILYMLNYPDVQRKIFHEIDQHVEKGRAPTLRDKPKLTYVVASILETQRLSSISPVSIVRTCPKDVHIKGFTVPRGSLVVPNLDSVLFDKTIWGQDAKLFRPERFIDEQGRLKVPEEFVPFGIGRRVCLGRVMANTELFLYISRMVQTFEFLPPRPGQPPSMNYVLGLTAVPEPYLVRALRRNTCRK
uniref:Cytochrome P450 n=1 Tax=Biomphalaria glabrata TaxID=6526 RepID=A0A182YW75_BIOGL